jgi:hypothetical protein
LVETIATYGEPETLDNEPISAAMAIHLADALVSATSKSTVDGTPSPLISKTVTAHPVVCENLTQWQQLANDQQF